MTLADRLLQDLLARAEREWARDGEKVIRLKISPSSAPLYFNADTRSQVDECHERMINLERKGVVTIEWERKGGIGNQLDRLTLANAALLAKELGVTPLWDAMQTASNALSPFFESHPVTKNVVAAWKGGKSPRGIGIQDHQRILDAIRVVRFCIENGFSDMPVRMASKRLGFDSKHLERIRHAIDLIASNEIDGSPDLHFDDIMGQIGLIRHPQPLLIAGPVTLAFGDESISIPKPYLGVPPDRITGAILDERVTRILTIENLTTFHEVLEHLKGDTVALYTNGMPSPVWRRFFKLIAIKKGLVLQHWGDIDAGGFRIARVIAKAAEDVGGRLQLINMDPSKIPSGVHTRPMNASEAKQIFDICEEMGWLDVAILKSITMRACEQEGLPVVI